jgi:hypothetical protein
MDDSSIVTVPPRTRSQRLHDMRRSAATKVKAGVLACLGLGLITLRPPG